MLTVALSLLLGATPDQLPHDPNTINERLALACDAVVATAKMHGGKLQKQFVIYIDGVGATCTNKPVNHRLTHEPMTEEEFNRIEP